MDSRHNEITGNFYQHQWAVRVPYLCSLSNKDLSTVRRDETLSCILRSLSFTVWTSRSVERDPEVQSLHEATIVHLHQWAQRIWSGFPPPTPRGNKTHWSASRSVLSTATAHRCSLQRNMIPSQRRHCHAAFGAFQGIGKAALPRDTFSRHLHGCWAASSLLPSMSCSSPIKLELPFTLTPVIFPILRLL